MDYFYAFADAILDILNEMSPFLLLGFLIAGILHAFIPNSWYARYLAGQNFRSVINAAVFGIPLPLCSCGVIPTAMSLRREGASKGAVTSFLIATPQTGIDSILATSSLMGLPFAIVRPIAALATALLGGAMVNGFDTAAAELHTNADYDRNVSEQKLSLWQRCLKALRFGFIEMMEDIGKWLIVGLIIAGLITTLVPDEWFAVFKDNTALSMLLVLAISIPMYVCATGSIPIAVALMLKGLTPGAALVLLMAGPAVNAASILVIRKVMGQRTLALYLISIIVGALLFGVGIDYLLPRQWFTQALSGMSTACHDDSNWLAWTSTIILFLLLLNVLRMRLLHKETCSCCHEHEHEGHCHCHEHEEHCHCHEHEDSCHCHEHY